MRAANIRVSSQVMPARRRCLNEGTPERRRPGRAGARSLARFCGRGPGRGEERRVRLEWHARRGRPRLILTSRSIASGSGARCDRGPFTSSGVSRCLDTWLLTGLGGWGPPSSLWRRVDQGFEE